MSADGGQANALAGRRRRRQVTIRHVAADAGVSLQTVSRVINNAPNVRPAVKQRVQSSIDKLGYVPSIAAQRLSGSRSYLILALNDRDRTIADWRERQGADWIDQMLLGGMLKVAEYGYRLMFELVDTHDDHVERELRATLAALQPDGVILTPPHSENSQITDLLEEVGIAFARSSPAAVSPCQWTKRARRRWPPVISRIWATPASASFQAPRNIRSASAALPVGEAK